MAYTQPEPLRGRHAFGDFCCEEDALDNWLHRHARHAEAAGSARTFVTTDGEHVVGFYALAIGQVRPDDATERLLKGQPAKRPIPVLVIARLAVDRMHKGNGVGRSLLQDALLRCAAVAESVGVRAVVAHANEPAGPFYDQFGFEASPTDRLHRILLMKDLRLFLESLED
jgi:predicted N-acetyltransferase YhbS